MPTRQEINVTTGERKDVELTPAELSQIAQDAANAAARQAQEDAAKAPTAVVARAVDSFEHRFLLETLFTQENRIRILEGKIALTKEQYRSALITAWLAALG